LGLEVAAELHSGAIAALIASNVAARTGASTAASVAARAIAMVVRPGMALRNEDEPAADRLPGELS
jgi:hypothetical protein